MSVSATDPRAREHCAQLVELSIGILLVFIQPDLLQRLYIKAWYRFLRPGLRGTSKKHQKSTKSPSVATLKCKVNKSRPGPFGSGRQRSSLACGE